MTGKPSAWNDLARYLIFGRRGFVTSHGRDSVLWVHNCQIAFGRSTMFD